MPRGTTTPGPLSAAMSGYMDSLLRRHGTSRDAVARRSGISTGRVSSLLNGQKPWYLEDVERFAVALGLEPLDVLDEFSRTTSGLTDPVSISPVKVLPRAEDSGQLAAADESADEDAERNRRGE